MASFGVTFKNRSIARSYRAMLSDHSERNKQALRLAGEGALEEMLRRGRADIAGAGRFGTRWTRGLRGSVDARGDNINVAVTHDVPYFDVHQEGRTIRGRPLLWIPLSYTGVTVRARDYQNPLVRVDRKSGAAPLLLDVVDKRPVYVGLRSVKIPKRFHVVEIIREVAKTIPQRFAVARRGKI